ncbi:MAG: ferredoxin:protochlorophyllide reductase (ATP-dependent) subunit B [Pseudomonadota bacterium]
MKLTLWSYEGPPHVGAMRVATAMREVHYVLHAPQGDTYADLLFTMIERRDRRPPVTYTTFQARDLGGDTAELFKNAARSACERFRPQALLVGASCTAELIQDDPGGLAATLGLPVPVVPLELPAYQKKENWGADETFYRLVRTLCPPPPPDAPARTPGRRCNLLGPTALGFRHRDDIVELERLLAELGVEVHVVAPYDATPADVARLPEADFNVLMYPELASAAAQYLQRSHRMPCTRTVPIGIGATRDFVCEVGTLAGLDAAAVEAALDRLQARAAWYSRSVDSTYLTGKRVFVFADATHALAAARVAVEELGFELVGLGTYTRERAREVREAAAGYGLQALITDDYLEVEARVAELHPELVLGTQMERHIAKRLGIPCAVISAPVHVQDFPARYAPQMGIEGANVLFDTWVHPLMMGLEEHLLGMFREDFEFHEGAAPSHLPRSAPAANEPRHDEALPAVANGAAPEAPMVTAALHATATAAGAPDAATPPWAPDAESELRKVPFFVRSRARRNTERYASERGLKTITVETLYDAKAHFSR